MKLVRFAGTRLVFLALLVGFLECPVSRAWGCKGHQTVALIAEKQLTPQARQWVDKLLSDNPIDPRLKRYCGSAVGSLMADASTWPDDVRVSANNGSWHYINIPRGAARGPLAQYCGNPDCVTQAISEQLSILKNKDADPHRRADALRYIIHFVGDLHMPLHASTNNDEGGICVPLTYLRRHPQENDEHFTPNLHSVWDTAIVERDMEGAEPPEYASYLLQVFGPDLTKWQAAGIHLDDWAWESHDTAETVVYGALEPQVPVEAPAPVHTCADANNIGERMLHLKLLAGENYQKIAAPVVERRIAQAGVRLAMILNEAGQ